MVNIDLTRNFPKQTTSKSVIRFQDCDPMRHLNNAKYFDYFFNAREDQLPKLYGFNVSDFFREYKTAWVAYSQKISYVRSALPGEIVTIHSQIIYANPNTVVVEYWMSDEADKQLKSILWTTLKYVDLKTQRTTNHQPELQEFMKKVVCQEANYENTRFDDRVKVLIQEYKQK